MKQTNKILVIAVVALIIGGGIGYFAGQRSAGTGPFAALQGLESSAKVDLCPWYQYNIDWARANDDGTRSMQRFYNGMISAYNKAGC
mgnify:CR=1 FL=1